MRIRMRMRLRTPLGIEFDFISRLLLVFVAILFLFFIFLAYAPALALLPSSYNGGGLYCIKVLVLPDSRPNMEKSDGSSLLLVLFPMYLCMKFVLFFVL